MISHSRIETSGIHSLTTGTVHAPPWSGLVRSFRSGLVRRWRIARVRTVCLSSGHEKWTVETGDWVCVRCGRLRVVRVPQVPTRLGRVARAHDLLRFTPRDPRVTGS